MPRWNKDRAQKPCLRYHPYTYISSANIKPEQYPKLTFLYIFTTEVRILKKGNISGLKEEEKNETVINKGNIFSSESKSIEGLWAAGHATIATVGLTERFKD